MTATVVLVHGAWHGAWCFDRVMPLLQEARVPAVAVDRGESCGAAAVEETAGLSHQPRPSLADGWVSHPDGTTTLTAAAAATCLYNDCDPDTVAWAVAKLGPQPMTNLAQTPAAVAWRDRPSTYIVCSDDQAIHPGLLHVLARR